MDETHFEWQRDIVVSNMKMVRALDALERRDEANTYARNAYMVLERLTARSIRLDSGMASTLRDLRQRLNVAEEARRREPVVRTDRPQPGGGMFGTLRGRSSAPSTTRTETGSIFGSMRAADPPAAAGNPESLASGMSGRLGAAEADTPAEDGQLLPERAP